MPRLLRCNICQTITKLPDYVGDPTQDYLLGEVTRLHQHDDKPEEERRTAGMLFTVDQATYDKMEAITKMGGHLDTHQWAHDEREQRKLDAHVCWQFHGRPDQNRGCPDYQSPSKMMAHPGGRVIPKKDRQYLCYYCPFQAHVTHKLRLRKGMYK